MQPFDLVDESHRIAIAPLRPELELATIAATMRTAARELDDRRTAHAETLLAVPVGDQLPADTMRIECLADHPRRRQLRHAANPRGDAGDRDRVATLRQGVDQL